jgi:hypothetical protein
MEMEIRLRVEIEACGTSTLMGMRGSDVVERGLLLGEGHLVISL